MRKLQLTRSQFISRLEKSKIQDVRVIRKKNQKPDRCHHLQVVLRSYLPLQMVKCLVGRIIYDLPEQNYLELELSMEKDHGGSYYCTQCGKRFDELEYILYVRLFEKAKKHQFNVWMLRKMFEQKDRGMIGQILMWVLPGKQAYRCDVSKMVAASIKLKKDEEKLYKEVMKRFR